MPTQACHILKLDDELLNLVVSHIIVPKWQPPVIVGQQPITEPWTIPDFASLFNLGYTCREMLRAVVRPPEDEGYWRSLLLLVGQGRACAQPEFEFKTASQTYRVKPRTIPTANVPWAEMAYYFAGLRENLLGPAPQKGGVAFLGRGELSSQSGMPRRAEYYHLSYDRHRFLPMIPRPEVHRVLTKQMTLEHSVPINYELMSQSRNVYKYRSYGNIQGAFFTRPAIPELDLYFTFDRASAIQLVQICEKHRIPIEHIAPRSGLHLKGSKPPTNVIFNPDQPVRVRNPHGITKENVILVTNAWINACGMDYPIIMTCFRIKAAIELSTYGNRFELAPASFAKFEWLGPVFEHDEYSTEDDWQFMHVGGGALHVRLRFDFKELSRVYQGDRISTRVFNLHPVTPSSGSTAVRQLGSLISISATVE